MTTSQDKGWEWMQAEVNRVLEKMMQRSRNWSTLAPTTNPSPPILPPPILPAPRRVNHFTIHHQVYTQARTSQVAARHLAEHQKYLNWTAEPMRYGVGSEGMTDEYLRRAYLAAPGSTWSATASGLTEDSSNALAAAAAEHPNSNLHGRRSGETALIAWAMTTMTTSPSDPKPTSTDSPERRP